MDAETYVKTVRRICTHACCDDCLLFDKDSSCAANPLYYGTINPIPIVEQWLKEHPEPKPLPGLPPKLRAGCTYGDMINTINQLIDYLSKREEKND